MMQVDDKDDVCALLLLRLNIIDPTPGKGDEITIGMMQITLDDDQNIPLILFISFKVSTMKVAL